MVGMFLLLVTMIIVVLQRSSLAAVVCAGSCTSERCHGVALQLRWQAVKTSWGAPHLMQNMASRGALQTAVGLGAEGPGEDEDRLGSVAFSLRARKSRHPSSRALSGSSRPDLPVSTTPVPRELVPSKGVDAAVSRPPPNAANERPPLEASPPPSPSPRAPRASSPFPLWPLPLPSERTLSKKTDAPLPSGKKELILLLPPARAGDASTCPCRHSGDRPDTGVPAKEPASEGTGEAVSATEVGYWKVPSRPGNCLLVPVRMPPSHIVRGPTGTVAPPKPSLY